MKVDVSFKHLERSEFIDDVLDKDLQKLGRRIKIFRRDDPIHISVHLEKNPHREQYFCHVHIYLPSKVLKANVTAGDPALAINKAFSAIVRQLDKLKYKIERHLRKERQTPNDSEM